MAKHILPVIEVLRKTASELDRRDDYQWGHMGSCNCGFLAQQVSHLQKNQIHTLAMQGFGDWSEQLNDYCPTSGLPMDNLIAKIVSFGFDTDDLKHLERLSDPKILSTLSPNENLRHNIKSDVVKYLRAWASTIEENLLQNINLPPLNPIPAEV